MRTRADLKGYQLEAIDFMRWNYFSALWLDMGLGKSVSVLTLLADLLADGAIRKALIIAPLRVAAQTWPDEIEKWEHTRHLTYTLIRPTGDESEVRAAGLLAKSTARALGVTARSAAQIASRAETRAEETVRKQLARSPTSIHIINRERLPWLVRLWGKQWPYNAVIFDEASGLRDHKSERFKALSAVRKYTNRMHQLTATPRPESYMDLFPQIWLLDRGERLGSSITAYRDDYFTYEPRTYKWNIRSGAADIIVGKISDIVLDMKAKDYLDLADPIIVDRPVTLSPAETALYQRLETTSVLELTNTVIEAETAGALFQKLLQFASGAVYDAGKQTHHIHDHKLHELEEIIEETQGAPMLIAYGFKSSLARLKKKFPDAVVLGTGTKEVAEWNRGRIPKLLIHPASAGHGLNLQYGGSLLSFFDIPSSYENYDQTIHRLARQGQEGLVRVFNIWAKGTEDQHSVPRLLRKQSDQNYMFARLQHLRRAISQRASDNDHGL